MGLEGYMITLQEGCTVIISANYLKLEEGNIAVFYDCNDDVEAVFKNFDYIHKYKRDAEE